MNFKKLVQVVNYMMAKYDYRLNYTKLIKLLYLADRECLDRYCFAISGDTYCSMQKGIVLKGLYDFVSGNGNVDEQTKWNSFFEKDKENDHSDLISIAKDSIGDEELSDGEAEILDEVDNRYHDKDCNYLVDEVIHKLPEWDKNVKRNDAIALDKRIILKYLGKSDEEIDELISLERSCDEMNKLFGVDDA